MRAAMRPAGRCQSRRSPILFRNGFRKRPRRSHICDVHRILGSLAAQCSLAAGLGALLAISGCSSAEQPTKSGPTYAASGGNPGANIDVGEDPDPDKASSGDGLSADGTCYVKTDGEVCAAQAYEGEAVPLDIYIMFDQSGSMLNDVGGITQLDAIERAAGTFLRDQASSAIGVGVGYFGYQPIGQTTCGASDYATPSVTVTLDHEAILGSLAQREPTGETPTGAAIRGACSYAQGWKESAVGHQVVVLLLTDGKPEAPATCQGGGCTPTLQDAVQAATDCAQSKAPIRT